MKSKNGTCSVWIDIDVVLDYLFQFNEHFLKKIPQGAEASNVLVGEVDFLNHPIIAFVRLAKAQMLGEY